MNKFEQLIEYVINDEQEKARELFHDIVVEKSREIYEEIMSEEEHEEEEPGWIEDMYLGKLNAKERERLNQEDRDNNPEPFNDGY